MGESAACLVRSFSQPSPTSEEEKKGNPIDRALTASVSFGRFMSESLDWGKWSAFNNNRYLEEVEKYSKPGSVAEKKAYFEAHFKRRRAAALLEQQNAAACTVSEIANTKDKIDNSSLDLGHVQRTSYEVTENMKAEIQSRNPVVPSGQSGNHDTSVERTLEDTKPGETEKVMEPLALMGNSLELTYHLEDDTCIGDTVSKKEANTRNKDDSAIRNSASGKKIPEVPSANMLTKRVASNFPPSVEPIVPVQLKNTDKSPESKRNSTDSSNKRRSYITSLHMSINLASCSGVPQKDTSSGLPKIENSRIIRAPAKKYKNSVLPQTSTRASVNCLIKHFSVAPTAENRRTMRPHGGSISEAKTADEKVQSPSSNYSKSSTLFGSRARLPTVPSTFTFKSEERAVKRREFFQMLEHKAKLKEKHQMHAKPQVTGRSNDKDVCNSIAVETSKVAEAPLRNIIKKIPTVRPCFPKIEERAAAFKVQDSNIVRPPWRFSVKTEAPKDPTAKNSRPPSHSAKCQPKKIMNENASPNIQL